MGIQMAAEDEAGQEHDGQDDLEGDLTWTGIDQWKTCPDYLKANYQEGQGTSWTVVPDMYVRMMLRFLTSYAFLLSTEFEESQYVFFNVQMSLVKHI